MKKFKYVLCIFAILFSCIISVNAQVGLCSYVKDPSLDPTSDAYKNQQLLYIFKKDTRTFIWTTDDGYTQMLYGNIDYDVIYKLLSATVGTTFWFNRTYDYTYTSLNGSMHRDSVVDIAWLNPVGTEPDKDVKKSFVEKGMCPETICICNLGLTYLTNETEGIEEMCSKANETATQHTVNGVQGHCETVHSVYKWYKDMTKESEGDPYTLNEKYSNALEAGISMKESLYLTPEYIDALNELFTLNIDGAAFSKATKTEKYVLAKLLVNFDPRIKTASEALADSNLKSDNTEMNYKLKELVNNAKTFRKYFSQNINLDDLGKETNCKNIIGDVNDEDSFAHYLQIILNFIQYLGPVLVIVLTSVDFFKAIFDNKDEIKNVSNKTIKRLIALALLFFIPLFTKLLLGVFGVWSDCGIK